MNVATLRPPSRGAGQADPYRSRGGKGALGAPGAAGALRLQHNVAGNSSAAAALHGGQRPHPLQCDTTLPSPVAVRAADTRR